MWQKILTLCLLHLVSNISLFSQSQIEKKIEFGGTFDNWRVREIKESGIIGGNIKHIYSIGKGDTIVGAIAYQNPPGWVWSTSNVLAIVKGVVKTSCSVFPEKRENGYCARLETTLEKVRVLGLLDLNVIATGTIYLGKMLEPIRNTNNPQSKLITGIPYTDKPLAISFDYKVVLGNQKVKASGIGAPKIIPGKDYADCMVLLQKRWEDKDGNIYAKRIGTAYHLFTSTNLEWTNNFRVPIHYGDIRKKSFYKDYMNLIPEELSIYTKNSKGKSVPVHEIEWGDKAETPTHIIVRFSSSHGEAYIGDPVNKLWIDNVKLVKNND